MSKLPIEQMIADAKHVSQVLDMSELRYTSAFASDVGCGARG